MVTIKCISAHVQLLIASQKHKETKNYHHKVNPTDGCLQIKI